ncbi:hypothetical protein [Proteus mirabilis]|uniref:hypothetical protein n=1 Tax=Proteus mirabilis TaxID=584 RepID=UPI0034D3F2B4
MYNKKGLWIVDTILILWSLWCVYVIPPSPALLITVTILPLMFVYIQFKGISWGKGFTETQYFLAILVMLVYSILTMIGLNKTGLMVIRSSYLNPYDFLLIVISIIALIISSVCLLTYSVKTVNCLHDSSEIEVYSSTSEKIVNWCLFVVTVVFVGSIFVIGDTEKYIIFYMMTWISLCSFWLYFHIFNEASAPNSDSDFNKANILFGIVNVAWVASSVYSVVPTNSFIGISIVPIGVTMTYLLYRLIKKLLSIKGTVKVTKEQIDSIIEHSKRNLNIK